MQSTDWSSKTLLQSNFGMSVCKVMLPTAVLFNVSLVRDYNIKSFGKFWADRHVQRVCKNAPFDLKKALLAKGS